MPTYIYNLTPEQFRLAIPRLKAAGLTGSHRETHDGYALSVHAKDSLEKGKAAEIVRYVKQLKPDGK